MGKVSGLHLHAVDQVVHELDDRIPGPLIRPVSSATGGVDEVEHEVRERETKDHSQDPVLAPFPSHSSVCTQLTFTDLAAVQHRQRLRHVQLQLEVPTSKKCGAPEYSGTGYVSTPAVCTLFARVLLKNPIYARV